MTAYSTYTDQQLTDLLKKGDHAAFNEIYHRYKKSLYLHAYQRLRNSDEVEDMIQDLFTVMWCKRTSLVFKTNLAGYLYTAMRNRVLNYVSHSEVESTYIKSFQGFIDKEYNFTDFLLREKELKALIDKEVGALPEKMREVFELSRKKGYSHKEIAEKLGVSQKTVKSQVNNALKILRVKLGFWVWLYMILC